MGINGGPGGHLDSHDPRSPQTVENESIPRWHPLEVVNLALGTVWIPVTDVTGSYRVRMVCVGNAPFGCPVIFGGSCPFLRLIGDIKQN